MWPNAIEGLRVSLGPVDYAKYAETHQIVSLTRWDDKNIATLLWLATVKATFLGRKGNVVKMIKRPAKLFCNMFDTPSDDAAWWPGLLIEDTSARNITKDRMDTTQWSWFRVKFELEIEIIFASGRLLTPATQQWQQLYSGVMDELFLNRHQTQFDRKNAALMEKYIRPLEAEATRQSLQHELGGTEKLTSATGLIFQYKRS